MLIHWDDVKLSTLIRHEIYRIYNVNPNGNENVVEAANCSYTYVHMATLLIEMAKYCVYYRSVQQ